MIPDVSLNNTIFFTVISLGKGTHRSLDQVQLLGYRLFTYQQTRLFFLSFIRCVPKISLSLCSPRATSTCAQPARAEPRINEKQRGIVFGLRSCQGQCFKC